MKKTFAAVATATALLVAGCSAPDTAPVTVTAAPAAETVTAPEMDLTEPSGIPGMTVGDVQFDAAETLASVPESIPAGQWAFIPEYAATYLGAAPAFPADYFTVESFDRPGIIHVYRATAALRA